MRIISPAEAIPIWLPFWFLYHRNWSTPDFAEGLEYLRRNPALFDRRHLLSDHNGKQVWHIQLPPEYGGRNVVYKSCSTPKSGRYWFQLSQAAREHRNYQLLYRLGIPAARILAIGESRRLFDLKSFFIVTEFIPGARDGRDFMCGGNLREDAARRRQFWERNMPYLAQIHRRGFLHKAFHPRNILWRENAAISATILQLACVDEGLASCWVHIDGRPRRKDEPGGETAAGYLRSFLPIPADCQPLCAVAAGYSDFTPAPLPGSDDDARIIRLE